MYGHPYEQGWRAFIRAAERRRRVRIWSVGLGVVGVGFGVLINWPF